MRIAVPREIKDSEYRVALPPAGVDELVRQGHEVGIETGAGEGSAMSDEEYRAAGATILPDAAATWDFGELIVKVKEPLADEFGYLQRGKTLFTYLHLAAEKAVAEALLDSKMTAIAYETVQLHDGTLPLLYPMSEVAGCLAVQMGAYYLTSPEGGRGVLLGSIGGVPNTKVVVLGGGVAGMNAANIALGMGADVTLLDINIDKLRSAFWRWHGGVAQLMSNPLNIEKEVLSADLVIGTVLIPGARAPKLVTNEMVAAMKKGSVLVDVAIDQGGCFEDSRPTSHANPTYRVHDSTFYCVANMPGAVPNTSTQALTNATLPYIKKIANRGWREALRDPAFAAGLNTHEGQVTHAAVAEALGIAGISAEEALAN